ncbi:MAG: glycerate dehydrogenase [Parasporobacterium sp.]|nr:glycerate dehydrogenase [Parasporobacterium sp.]
MAKKVLSTVIESRFDKYGIHFPADWEVKYLDFPYTDEQMIEAAKDVDYIFVNATHPVTANVIKNCGHIKLIQSEGVAFDKIDIAAAKEMGIPVSNNRGANANGVAELTVGLMMAAYRRIALSDKRLKREDFVTVKNDSLAMGIHELGGKHIGFVGMGAIAKEAVKRLQNWNVTISYYDVFRPTPEQEQELGITYMPYEKLVRECDVLSFHVPALPETINMLSTEQFKAMKNTAIVVNTARGEVIDQAALAKALEAGEIAHAALDVLTPEPTPADHPLLNMTQEGMDRLTLTPHVGGMTDEAFITMLNGGIDNFARVENGEAPINVVNK